MSEIEIVLPNLNMFAKGMQLCVTNAAIYVDRDELLLSALRVGCRKCEKTGRPKTTRMSNVMATNGW